MSCQIKNNANLDLTDLQPHINGMYDHFHQKLGFQKPPVIVFDSDPSNESNVLGKTAYYDPQSFEVHVYTDGRHPKDMLRSIAHELIHHQQNLEGRLDVGGYNGPGYYLENDKMKKIEQEAMLQGNAILREYEDGLKLEEMNKMSLKEWKNNELNSLLLKKFGILKENKMVDEELTDKQEKNLPDNLKAAIEKKEGEEGNDAEKNESVRAMREPNRANFTGQKTDAELTALREEEESEEDHSGEVPDPEDEARDAYLKRLRKMTEDKDLDEGYMCEECGGKHYMKEEDELEEGGLADRAENSENAAGRKEGGRYKRMQESIRRTLKENRNIRLKIKR